MSNHSLKIQKFCDYEKVLTVDYYKELLCQLVNG